MSELIQVEVAYASRERAEIIALTVPLGATIREVISLSGIMQQFPEIDLATQAVGIFSKKRELTDEPDAGDRIEIYRPLTIDPKEARRAKANLKAQRDRQSR